MSAFEPEVGHLPIDNPSCNPVIRWIGLRFGKLTVVGVGTKGFRDASGRKQPRKYECLCDCGNTVFVAQASLSTGNTKSCGCLKKCAGGLSSLPEYKVWKEMHRRCGSETSNRYAEWGGRGIKVCEEWVSFDRFIDDMGRRPSPKHSIERIDNDRGYCKDNCYWATPEDQNNNKSNNRIVEMNGVRKTLAQWCKELELNYYTIRSRIYINGWSDEDALLTPIKNKNARESKGVE